MIIETFVSFNFQIKFAKFFLQVSDKSQVFSVLIADGESPFALEVVQCLASIKTIRIFILSSKPTTRIRYSRHIEKFIHYKESKPFAEERIEAIINAAKSTKADVILPLDVPTIQLLIHNKEKFESVVKIAPQPSPESFEIGHNKWQLYKFLRANHFPTPDTILLTGNNNFEEEIKNLSFPVLAKPTQKKGGSGIQYFEDEDTLNDLMKTTRTDEEYIIQSYIEGYNLGFNVLALDGEILSSNCERYLLPHSKLNFRPSYGLEYFHHADALKTMKPIVAKLGWTGVANFDLRFDAKNNAIKVLEMNTRYWGNLNGPMLAGINYPYLACVVALNLPFPLIQSRKVSYVTSRDAIRYFKGKLLFKKNLPHFDFNVTKFIFNDPGPFIFMAIKKLLN